MANYQFPMTNEFPNPNDQLRKDYTDCIMGAKSVKGYFGFAETQMITD